MDDSREIELVRKAQKGDHAAYGQLVDLYGGAVLAVAYSRTGNYTVAQDIAQDAFLLGFENIGKLRQPNRFGLWLRTITKNLCKDWQRSEIYRRQLNEDSAELRGFFGSLHAPQPAKEAERNEMLGLLDEALHHLPVHDREILLLYYFEGKSVAEAAEALDISAGAMKKRLERARKRLRDPVTARVETGLQEAAKGRKMSDRILAAVPLGASYAKVAPVTAVLPGAPALTIAGILVKAGPTALAYGKVAAIVIGICIGGAVYMTRENLSSRPLEPAPVERQPSVLVEQEPAGPTRAAEEPAATEEQEPITVTGFAADMAEEPDTRSISGTVLDSAGTLLSGARVVVIESEVHALTDEQGKYAIGDLEPGSYTLVALDSANMRYGTGDLELTGKEKCVLDITVRERAARVRGTVLDIDGKPARDKTTIHVSCQGQLKFEPEVDGNGSYDSGAVPPGQCTILARPPRGYRMEPEEGYEVQLSEGEEFADAHFILSRMTNVVQGTIIYPNGGPVPDKTVRVGAHDTVPLSAKTDEGGRFRIEDIEGEDLYIEVGQPGRSFSSEGDQEWLYIGGVSAGSEELTLVLRPVGFLSGVVILAEGDTEPVKITIEGELGLLFDDHIPHADGSFEVELQPDVYKVSISSEDGRRTFESIAVESDMVTDLGEIELVPEMAKPDG